ncbi:helix-turn-helix domain-containing protein [Pseudobacteriovorax antillogorgiicola]|uniref:TIGR02147 family protein n=1 Tax=Pseudobacteriovorax antillogorgiicola TaxID=1513793 RepID=A0A1Y6CW41_9BACT|nr:helix-turn-helix domain-containing protein [Pseudobacteriovorax antillogorgiicola]TCS43478.1 uncharacterized protein (TIGR02147 family) [Pseudobacteriovorax antillogorgiicola]SMF81280.1 TIGR02147 family protein [Pseudobacteriovorax antillogorgiicola]
MEYISFLIEMYSQKKNSNPRYSKRAFAKDLGIDQGFLSHLLNGKRKLSLQKAHEISENLDLSLRSANQFIGLVRAAHISDPEKKEKLLASLNKSSIVETSPT